MDLELSDEQRWLSESVGGLLDGDADVWPALVEFGALSIASGDDPGVGAVELALIGRELGERLASTPFVDTTAARYGLRGTPLASVAARSEALALALLEPGGGWDLERPATRIAAGALDGNKSAVERPGRMDALLVLAAEDGARRLAVVGTEADGVTLTEAPAIDDSLPTATVAFAGVGVAPDHALSAAATELVLERLLAIGGVLAAAEAVGAAGRALELAREYAAQRRQFGRPIGSFQALRHLLADMYVRESSAWSTVLYAAAALEDGLDDALQTCAIAKAYASRATLAVAHGALQVFAGIGFTAEHPAHRYLRRIVARGQRFGDARHHERAIGRGLADAARPHAMAP